MGSLVEFTAKFLGRRLVYTYEIAELVPGTRFVMRTADGPFPMVTTYEFSDVGAGATRMTLRNHGTPAGFAKIAARGMERAMRSANEKDVQRLKAILEAPLAPLTTDGVRKRCPASGRRRRRDLAEEALRGGRSGDRLRSIDGWMLRGI